MIDKLQRLIDGCKGSVEVLVNCHTDSYQTAESRLKELVDNDQIEEGDIDSEIMAEMIRKNTIVNIVFYPNSPVGNYNIYHHDLDECLDICLSCLM